MVINNNEGEKEEVSSLKHWMTATVFPSMQAFASSMIAICGINLCLVNFGSDKHLAHVILGQLFQNSNLNKK